MYLVDTNVWLERLLDQQRSEEAGDFLDRAQVEGLFISDFSFHSICIALSRLDQWGALLKFVQDAFVEGPVVLLHLGPSDTHDVGRAMEEFKLDFDDAYQYVAAEKHNLTIISFDGDFDGSERGRKTPAQMMRG